VADRIELVGRFLAPDGSERACRLRVASLDDMQVVGGGVLSEGTPVICDIAGLGLLRASAGLPTPGGFTLILETGDAQRTRLAARLGWHQAKALGRVDLRRNARVVPAWTAVSVRWPGGEVEGTLRDVSADGTAVDLSPRPDVGSAVTVGRRRGTVVRHTEHGIGVRFSLPLRPEDVTEHVRL
jgi:hypothetical protein